MTDKISAETNHSSTAPAQKESLQPTVALLWGIYLGVILTLLGALFMSGEGVATWAFWGGEEPDRSAILRNLGLIALGAIGLPLAIWRGVTASRQANAANEQAVTANRQANLAEKGQIIDRYQKGAQMLESEELAVRMAGVFALRELALNEADEMYFNVMDLLAAFIRAKTRQRLPDFSNVNASNPFPDFGLPPQDLQEALNSITFIRKNIDDYESFERFKLNWKINLSGANLHRFNISNSNIKNIDFSKENMSYIEMETANAQGATFKLANLFGADLFDTDFTRASFNKANLCGADLTMANFSKARLSSPTIDDNTIFHISWAFEDSPPRSIHTSIKDLIIYRKKGERWGDFLRRHNINY